MAAIRSALAMLGRRSCGSSGYSAAASFGGRGLEIHQVFHPAAPRAPPLPTLRPTSRNLESLRRFSTKETDKSEGVVRVWWQRCRNRVNNLDGCDRVNFSAAYATVLFVGCATYGLMSK
ncbi:unnamed protein product [Urochloa humidicola]